MKREDSGQIKAIVSTICTLSLLTILIAPTTFAQSSSGGISISPALVDVTLTSPQEEKTLEFVLVNSGTRPLSLTLYPINFNQKNEYGGINFLGQDAKSYSYSLASFLSFETQTVELAAGQKETVRVTAKNRSDLSSGGHYAAIVARVIQESGETSIAPAVSALILLRKTGGERYHLSLKDFDWPANLFVFSYPSGMQLLFQNEGNVHLTPFGRIDVTDMFGRKIHVGIINENSTKVLPENRRYITAQFRKTAWSFPLSVNKMEIRGQDSLQKTQFTSTETFIYIHPGLFAVLLFIMIGVIYLRKKIRPSKHK